MCVYVYLRQGQQVGQRQHHVSGKSIIGQLQQNYRGEEEKGREEDELSPRRREATAAGGGLIVFCDTRETRPLSEETPSGWDKKGDGKKEYVMRRKTKSLNGAVLSLGCSTRIFRASWFLTKTTFISQTHFIPAPSFLSHFFSQVLSR